ncbi:MAG: hypothetical protein ACE5KF_05630, partial [Kiloniellaceae bacterium]
MKRRRRPHFGAAFQLKATGDGLDVSGGLKSVRIGANKRGHYIRVGRKRVYYGAITSRADVQSSSASKPLDQEDPSDNNSGRVGDGELLNERQLAFIDEAPSSVISDLSETHRKVRL